MGDYWEATQQTLGKLIKKPTLKTETLQKPPFRFLHDIVTEVMKATGFPDGLFSPDELNSANIQNKEQKVAFLQKIIDHVSATVNIQIPAKPLKIVAGLEPENTNFFLQMLAKAASGGGEESSPSQAAPKAAERSRQEAQPEASRQRSGSHSRSVSEPAPQEPEQQQPQQTSGKSRRTVSDVNEANTPPVVPQINTAQIQRQSSAPSSRAPPQQSQDDSQRAPSAGASRNRPPSGRREAPPPPQQDEDEDQGGAPQRIGSAAAARAGSASRRREEEQGYPPQSGYNPYSQSQGDEDDGSGGGAPQIPPATARNRGMVAPAAMERPQTARRAPPKLPTNVRSVDRSDVHSASKEGSRAMSAGIRDPVAPVIAQGGPMAPSAAIGGGLGGEASPASTTAVIVEKKGAAASQEDDEDDTLVIETNPELAAPKLPASISGGDQQHGQLVRSLLEAKKASDATDQQNEGSGSGSMTGRDRPSSGGIILRSQRKGSAQPPQSKESVLGEITKLREGVQALVQSTHPLGRVMDFLQEDLENMARELERWQNESKTQRAALEEQKKLTETSLDPMRRQLVEAEEQVKEQMSKINSMKASILKNDVSIETLLRMVVSPTR